MPKDIPDPPDQPPQPPVPPLQHVLELARKGVLNPSQLTAEDIRDLSHTLLVQYAHMGIHEEGGD